jgi:glutathione synthase/RimK-type ligase-like ATP-grasp enzyme
LQRIETSEHEPDFSGATTFAAASLNQSGRIAHLWKRGVLLEANGRGDEARGTWIALLGIEPSHLGALNRLGGLLAAAGENGLAREVFAEAVAQHPADPMSRVNLANVLIKDDEHELARKQLEQALIIDANFRAAHAGLAFILPRLGEPELATWHGRIAFQGQSLVEAKYRGDAEPICVLELISTRGGNVRIQNFLSDRIFQRYIVTAEFYDSNVPLPEHQLVVNAIGDADVASAALAGAEAVLAHTSAPVINRPAAVLATGRAAVAQRMSGVPGVVTARTAAVSRGLLDSPHAAAALGRVGFGFPLLLRSPGFHGGEHFLRLDSSVELPAALESLPGQELLVIQYLDARSGDGKIRKYRVMTIDGRLYPLHCAVSSNWKIHYFSAEMAGNAEHRAEDAAFLAEMPKVLGPRVMAALSAIQDALGLDYGGIDFGIHRDGDLLLFEANATMVILPPGAEAKWDYRRPAVERVCRAVHAMLMERAGCGETALVAHA